MVKKFHAVTHPNIHHHCYKRLPNSSSPPVQSTCLMTICMKHRPFKKSTVIQPIKKFTTSLLNLRVNYYEQRVTQLEHILS